MKSSMILLSILGYSMSFASFGECKIDQGSFTLSTHMVQKAVEGSEDEQVRNAFANDNCIITKGWQKGGDIPENLPAKAEHITVKVPGYSTCYIFDHPDLFGVFKTVCS
ncbi:hypothetical protein ORQ98_09175 [Spartinivicinus sp. A2-2]|uniref:Uncharacterized protein n=2 Tax=Spartinivicinus poritis TaxID=2994640 RepID=A0ABT5U6Z9_9GAMM|nr:hypothetical protein [Spartinivicinus sp. A2-2]